CQQLLEFLHGRHGYQHFVEGDQADRIGALNVADVDMRQVARSQVQVLVNGFGDDQHVVQAQAVQLAQQTLGLRSVDGEVFDHYQAIQTNQLGEDGAQSSAVHLL